MKFISLFSGIGGFDLGLERAGMQCVGQVEINLFCQRVLEKHWPDVKRIGDIKDVNETTFESAELICGGFPCQPFSVAGKRKGRSDNRYLWPEMLRVIKIYKPDWVIGENVAGIIKMELDQVLFDLESEKYTCRAFVIPACAVDAAHRRDRVWIIANSNGQRFKEQWRTKSIQTKQYGAECLCRNASHSERVWELQPERGIQEKREWDIDICQDVRNSTIKRFPNWAGGEVEQPFPLSEFERPGSEEKGREIERDFCGVAHGVSSRVDRIKALGNAVVPQIVEIIGKAIVKC